MRNEDSANDAGFASGTASRIAVLTLLFSAAAIWESEKLASMADPAVWGHLRMGSWILENRSWPETGLFSQASNVRWMDFTWAYDLLAALAYRALGLRAIPALLIVFRVGLAVISFFLAGGWRGDFWMAVGVSAATQYVLLGLGPGAAFVSGIFFGMQVLLLIQSRRSGNAKPLFGLPALFFIWANLDFEFVYGIAVLALFLLVLVVERVGHRAGWKWLDAPVTGIPTRLALIAGGLSFLASLITPYTIQTYAEFFAVQTSDLNRHLPGYTAMSFHQSQDYVLMLLVMAAVLLMGRRRSRDLVLLVLLAVCAVLSFHAQRVNWLIAIAAAAVIGETSSGKGEATMQRISGLAWRRHIWVPAGLAIVLAASALVVRVPRSREALLAKAAEHFPVRACDYIREHHLPAPLFNSYVWGDFLTWYLPEYPVAIDLRRGLYPDEEEVTYFRVMNAELPYQSLPSLERAGTLLLEKGTVMAEALRSMPDFRVAYQDEISLVLLHQNAETGVR
jgi:hypothetical protein